MYPACSLIVSTYNWPTALDLSLKSLLAQTDLPKEIIIADDGSRPDTRQLIDDYQARAPIPIKQVWHADEGFRKTIILNEAVREAQGEYIIQIDGDIIVHPAFVKDHLRAAKKGQFVRGSRTLIDAKTSANILHTGNTRFNCLSKGISHRFNAIRLPGLAFLFKGNPHSPADVKGCNMAFWKSDFIAINGYNNSLTGWGHEDGELAARLINNGIRKRHLKFAAVCHHIDHQPNARTKAKHNKSCYEDVLSLDTKWCTDGYATSAKG